MKTSKNFAPSVLPIPVRESDEPLQSGQFFFMRVCRKCGGEADRKNRLVCSKCSGLRGRELHRERRAANQKAVSIPDLEGEEWRVVQEFPNYVVSNLGRVKRLALTYKDKRGGIYIMPERLSIPILGKRGYWVTSMADFNGRKRVSTIHRIIAIAFIPNPENKEHINHKDKNKANNSLDNIEWVTQAENMLHAWEGRRLSKYPGVQYERANKNWKTSVKRDRKTIHIGCFQTEEEAYAAYKQYCKDHNIQNKYA